MLLTIELSSNKRKKEKEKRRRADSTPAAAAAAVGAAGATPVAADAPTLTVPDASAPTLPLLFLLSMLPLHFPRSFIPTPASTHPAPALAHICSTSFVPAQLCVHLCLALPLGCAHLAFVCACLGLFVFSACPHCLVTLV